MNIMNYKDPKCDGNIQSFKDVLNNTWFDRSGDTDGIAVGVNNELKYVNADDFERKNPSLFTKMYNRWAWEE